MMKQKLSSLLAMLLLLGLFAGCTSGSAATPNNTNANGTILLYTSQPDEDAALLVAAFNSKYPDITVEVFRSGTEEVISKVYAEKQGGKILADLLLVADNVTFESLKQDDMLLSYTSPELKGLDDAYVDPDHMFYGTKAIASVICYNTNLATNIPEDWSDLLEDYAYNQISMASPLYSGAAAYQLGVLTRDFRLGWDYYDGLKARKAKVGKGNGGVITDVISGEKAYGLVIDYMANNSKKEGNPLDFVYPATGSVVITEPIGILKTSQNPEAAKLFLDFIISREGQQMASAMGYVPLRTDVTAPDGLRTVDQITQLDADIQIMYENREDDKNQFSQKFE